MMLIHKSLHTLTNITQWKDATSTFGMLRLQIKKPFEVQFHFLDLLFPDWLMDSSLEEAASPTSAFAQSEGQRLPFVGS